ncbi:MAG: ATP-grasp domain-containing protein [Acidobacteria bacterium]|nr:ATP-grasp domain-containing protein [Acidobacteriota bacterium]
MPRVLLLATTTGYQTRAFGDAAGRLGVDLVFATDRCQVLDDPWRDGAIAIRFHDEVASVRKILAAGRARAIDGVLVVGDRPTVIGARVLEALGLPGHSPSAAAIARNKERTRGRLLEAGLPAPWFTTTPIAADPARLATEVPFPCVIKPLALSGSRGVMRADDPEAFTAAFRRLRALLRSPELRAERTGAHERALIESFVSGREYAVEGLMHHGDLQVLAIFDKPDPLDGPFFEETIYVTPSAAPGEEQRAIREAVAAAARAIGLSHGPVHAECRVSRTDGAGAPRVVVLEAAARPIGGLCARALEFVNARGARIALEELLLRHALGESPAGWTRAPGASGVMMMPIPRRGIFRRASGIDDARAVPGITDVRVTAKPDQRLVPLPEGASYLGFVFARAASAPATVEALRCAHARLRFDVDVEVPIVGTTA